VSQDAIAEERRAGLEFEGRIDISMGGLLHGADEFFVYPRPERAEPVRRILDIASFNLAIRPALTRSREDFWVPADRMLYSL